jgi:hypothetical protein
MLSPAAATLLELRPDGAVKALAEIAVRDVFAAAEVLREIADMSRPLTRTLTAAQRATRREMLVRDRITVWTIDDVGRAAGLQPSAATKWRNVYLNNGGVKGDNALIPPNVPTGRPYRQPGDPKVAPEGHPGYQPPMFYAGDVRHWLAGSGRVDGDLYPHEDSPGRMPPGRTPAPRTETTVDELAGV